MTNNLAELKLPRLYPAQRKAIFAPERYSIIEASTKAGKTVGCMVWLLSRAWEDGGIGRNYWWVAPVSEQANIAFKRIRNGLSMKPAPKINLTNKTIELPNGATIWFKSGDTPDSLYGEDVHAVVIDEASRVKEDSWYAIRSTLTQTRGQVRIIGNVKGRKNWSYQLARKAESGAPDMSYHKLTALDAVAGGVLDPAEVDDARRMLPEHVFRELYLAEPADDGGNPFGAAAIEACVAPMSSEPPICYGSDLAKSFDYTVCIGIDKNGTVCRFERWQSPWIDTKKRIALLCGSTPVLMDSTGVGDPIVEDLQRERLNVEGFKFNSSSKQQLMEGLQEAISERLIRFPDGTIKKELDIFEYEYTRNGVKYSAPPGQHDDCVMALALAVAKWRSQRLFSFDYLSSGIKRGAAYAGL